MKREFLRGLDLSDEVIDKIMAKHGETVEKFKAAGEKEETLNQTIQDLKEQLGEANEQIKEFQDMDIEGIKKAATEWEEKAKNAQSESEKKIQKMQFDHALEGALKNAKARNVKAVGALLDLDGIKFENGKLTGLEKQLETLKQDSGYLFEEEPTKPQFSASQQGQTGGGGDAAIRAAMGLPPEQK